MMNLACFSSGFQATGGRIKPERFNKNSQEYSLAVLLFLNVINDKALTNRKNFDIILWYKKYKTYVEVLIQQQRGLPVKLNIKTL